MTKAGISQKRLDRLIVHLGKMEQLVGKLCGATLVSSICPIQNFSPLEDKENGKKIRLVGISCIYYECGFPRDLPMPLYESSDSNWWGGLSIKTREKVTNYIQNWIKERYVEGVKC